MRSLLTFLLFAALCVFLCGCSDEPIQWRPVQPAVHREVAPDISLPNPIASPTAGATDTSQTALDYLAPVPEPTVADRMEAPDALNGDGLKMPTQHSHWLRGIVTNAHIVVTLNGLYMGNFTSGIDRDITMSCRPGANTIAFSGTSLGPDATARLEVVEGEHDPPIPALVAYAFRNGEAGGSKVVSVPATPGVSAAGSAPQEQTFSFTAK